MFVIWSRASLKWRWRAQTGRIPWGPELLGGGACFVFGGCRDPQTAGNAKRSSGRMRADQSCGGTIESDGPPSRSRSRDWLTRRTDGRTLMELYGKMALQPLNMDLTICGSSRRAPQRPQSSLHADERAPAAIRAVSLAGR